MIRVRSRSKEKNRCQIVIDLEESPYVLEKGSIIGRKYEYVELISEGTFGRVLRVRDLNTNVLRALKFIKDQFNDCSLEYHMIRKLLFYPYLTDHQGRKCIVKVLDYFSHGPNKCILFEELSLSLYDYMIRYRRTFNVKQIQIIMRDCINGLDYINKLNMVHTDIKPENIVFRENGDFHVKLIDFGNAVITAYPRKGLINTRHYRAPEVILDLEWYKSSDIWGLGCVIMELYCGQVLFDPDKDDHAHLAMIEKICGKFPKYMMNSSKFFSREQLLFPQQHHSRKLIKKVDTVCQIITKNQLLNDILAKMLEVDPIKRPIASDLKLHPFLFQNI